MKASQIAAKSAVRIFLILLVVAMIPFLKGDTIQLQHIYLAPKNPWVLAFPILLILCFITLLIICAKNKYKYADLNWVLTLNTIILIIYGVMVSIRIYQLTK